MAGAGIEQDCGLLGTAATELSVARAVDLATGCAAMENVQAGDSVCFGFHGGYMDTDGADQERRRKRASCRAALAISAVCGCAGSSGAVAATGTFMVVAGLVVLVVRHGGGR